MDEYVRSQGYRYIRAKDELVLHNIKTDVKIAPRYNGQSMGAESTGERAVHAQVRCLKVHIEKFAGIMLDPNMTIWPWMVRHAA
eukprot:16441234-Heterocapsa_arctica.AAC.1